MRAHDNGGLCDDFFKTRHAYSSEHWIVLERAHMIKRGENVRKVQKAPTLTVKVESIRSNCGIFRLSSKVSCRWSTRVSSTTPNLTRVGGRILTCTRTSPFTRRRRGTSNTLMLGESCREKITTEIHDKDREMC